MAKKKQRPLLLILFFVLAIVALLRFEKQRQAEQKQAEVIQTEAPQFFLEQAITTYYGENGKIAYQLNSEHMAYFDHSSTAKVQRPYFIFYNQEGRNWHSRSDQATLHNDSGDILLSGNVRAWQPDRHLELNTSELLITESRSKAQTEKPVELKEPSGHIQSIGMSVDLEQEKLQLTSRVKGIYHAR